MDINAYGNLNKTNDLLDEFMFGYRGNVSEEQMKNVEEVKNYVNWWNQFGSSNFSWLSFSHLSSQKCENLFISMSFRGNKFKGSTMYQNFPKGVVISEEITEFTKI